MPEALYKAKGTADVVTVPARRVLSFEGSGPPEGDAFGRAVAAIYGVAYSLKFARKARHGDFKVGPLEGRWWASTRGKGPAVPPRSKWLWRLRMAVPDDVTEKDVAAAVRAAVTKKGGKLEKSLEATRVQLEEIPAQRLGRALHIGPYAEEGRTFEEIRRALVASKIEPARSHLEIYLSDPSRTPPEKLKTVLLRETA